MLENSKVIWKEGMFLQPQHFQQLERYFFNTINSRMGIYHPFFYGVLEVEIDRDALVNSLFTLTRCTGILPDGTIFSMPREDTAPTARSFADFFSHDQNSLDVFLALPLVLTNKPNVSSAATGESYYNLRYKSKMANISDEVFGTQRKEIEIGLLNFQILFGGESLDDFSTLQIARLKRAPNGQITIEDNYIPPLLHIGGSRFLMSMLRSLLEMLVAKCNSLAQGRRQVEGGFAEFSSSEETAFRLLETLSTYTPLLNYHFNTPVIHPFELYTLLMMFAGSLSTFSTEVSLKDFPKYNHHNLSATYLTLIKIIRTVLEADISAACITIPVEQINQAVYMAKVPDEKLFKTAKFYFGVSAKVPEKELIVGVLQRIKMSSRDRLELLISSAMPGLPLKHCLTVPEELSTKPGYLYFSLDQNNPFWEGIKTSGTIAFYFPNNFPELKMELLALKS
ncbi:MAG: type VI secretion system baseplate subunit TssK [Chitinispirillaceae bacterium]|nr:type VI secretion system baseplate subunit TssK [Chitinispirillaceae bacterium]